MPEFPQIQTKRLHQQLAVLHTERWLNVNIGQIPLSFAFRGDAQYFQEMLGNVIDNACK